MFSELRRYLYLFYNFIRMANLLVYSLLLLGIASLNLFFALKFLRDKKYAENYIKTSPKARVWKKIF